MLEARCNYGPLKKKHDYRVLDEGCDWFFVAYRGKGIFVPKWVFEDQ